MNMRSECAEIPDHILSYRFTYLSGGRLFPNKIAAVKWTSNDKKERWLHIFYLGSIASVPPGCWNNISQPS